MANGVGSKESGVGSTDKLPTPDSNSQVLYVTGEESTEQVKLRADRLGALLVGLTVFATGFAFWALSTHFIVSASMADLAMTAFAQSLAKGTAYMVLYLALEPVLRLRWPHSLITWNRVLAGRWSDPQVGSHILMGLALGIGLRIFSLGGDVTMIRDESLDTFSGLYLLTGTRYWMAGIFSRILEALGSGLYIFFGLFGLRMLLRKDWIAAIAGGILVAAFQSDLVNSLNWQAELTVYIVMITALVFAMLRFGLVVCVTAIFALNCANGITLGTNWTAWYAPTGFATIGFVLLITAFAFRAALGERELL